MLQVVEKEGHFFSRIHVEDIAENFTIERQQAKAVTFGIMYGAGPWKISEQVTKDSGEYFSPEAAKDVIADYFKSFKGLKKWLDGTQEYIKEHAEIYSFFGRKRRLPNVMSDNKGVASHEVRSGLNFLVQSVASDINLLGAVDAHAIVKNAPWKANIFALVHDSILAEGEEPAVDYIEEYSDIVLKCVQKDRGLSIPGCPVGCDFDIGDDYSFGKFESKYAEL